MVLCSEYARISWKVYIFRQYILRARCSLLVCVSKYHIYIYIECLSTPLTRTVTHSPRQLMTEYFFVFVVASEQQPHHRTKAIHLTGNNPMAKSNIFYGFYALAGLSLGRRCKGFILGLPDASFDYYTHFRPYLDHRDVGCVHIDSWSWFLWNSSLYTFGQTLFVVYIWYGFVVLLSDAAIKEGDRLNMQHEGSFKQFILITEWLRRLSLRRNTHTHTHTLLQ